MKSGSLLFILSLLLSGCAMTYQNLKIVPPNSNNTDVATIYVLRESAFGSAVQFSIYQNGQFVGELGPGSYLAWEVKPNGKELNIMGKAENEFVLTINPQAGQTYYIKQKVKPGIILARTELVIMDEDIAKTKMQKLKAPKSNYVE
jgi:hypothetical protein